jgi:hypothetical protein
MRIRVRCGVIVQIIVMYKIYDTMETSMPFINADDALKQNRLQLTMRDMEQHKEWVASKTGGIDPQDVIYVMGDNNISHLILPTLRRHNIAVFAIVYLAYSAFWILYYYYPAWKFVHNLF